MASWLFRRLENCILFVLIKESIKSGIITRLITKGNKPTKIKITIYISKGGMNERVGRVTIARPRQIAINNSNS